LKFLANWKDASVNIVARIETLWVELYERDYIGLADVEAVQQWLLALPDAGYKFPEMSSSTRKALVAEHVLPSVILPDKDSAPRSGSNTRSRSSHTYSDVALVGQFNYNTETRYVRHWVEKWSELFRIVQVRGPFNSTNLAELKRSGIDAYVSADDAGYSSPMKNLGDSLRTFSDKSGIKGVMYLHDDLLLNLTHLVELGFPGDNLLTQAPPEVMERPYLLFNNHSKYRRFDRLKFHNASDNGGGARLKGWRWWKFCISSFAEAAKDHRADNYVRPDGLVPSMQRRLQMRANGWSTIKSSSSAGCQLSMVCSRSK
jgi:hypothetical protein